MISGLRQDLRINRRQAPARVGELRDARASFFFGVLLVAAAPSAAAHEGGARARWLIEPHGAEVELVFEGHDVDASSEAEGHAFGERLASSTSVSPLSGPPCDRGQKHVQVKQGVVRVRARFGCPEGGSLERGAILRHERFGEHGLVAFVRFRGSELGSFVFSRDRSTHVVGKAPLADGYGSRFRRAALEPTFPMVTFGLGLLARSGPRAVGLRVLVLAILVGGAVVASLTSIVASASGSAVVAAMGGLLLAASRGLKGSLLLALAGPLGLALGAELLSDPVTLAEQSFGDREATASPTLDVAATLGLVASGALGLVWAAAGAAVISPKDGGRVRRAAGVALVVGAILLALG